MGKFLSKVAKAWSEKVGREIAFKTVEVEAKDGRKQTQLINPETGGVVVAVNLVGDEAVEALVANAGTTFIDPAFDWVEVEGGNEAHQVDKADVSVSRPDSKPGAAVEAEKSKDAGELAEDRE